MDEFLYTMESLISTLGFVFFLILWGFSLFSEKGTQLSTPCHALIYRISDQHFHFASILFDDSPQSEFLNFR